MQVLQYQRKGTHLNTIERFFIYKAFSINNHLNDEFNITPNRTFEALLKPSNNSPTSQPPPTPDQLKNNDPLPPHLRTTRNFSNKAGPTLAIQSSEEDTTQTDKPTRTCSSITNTRTVLRKSLYPYHPSYTACEISFPPHTLPPLYIKSHRVSITV